MTDFTNLLAQHNATPYPYSDEPSFFGGNTYDTTFAWDDEPIAEYDGNLADSRNTQVYRGTDADGNPVLGLFRGGVFDGMVYAINDNLPELTDNITITDSGLAIDSDGNIMTAVEKPINDEHRHLLALNVQYGVQHFIYKLTGYTMVAESDADTLSAMGCTQQPEKRASHAYDSEMAYDDNVALVNTLVWVDTAGQKLRQASTGHYYIPATGGGAGDAALPNTHIELLQDERTNSAADALSKTVCDYHWIAAHPNYTALHDWEAIVRRFATGNPLSYPEDGQRVRQALAQAAELAPDAGLTEGIQQYIIAIASERYGLFSALVALATTRAVYLTPKQVSEQYDISQGNIRSREHKGNLPGVIRSGSALLVPRWVADREWGGK